MAGKKPLSPANFRKKVEKHIKSQRTVLKGKKAMANAKARTKHYGKGDKLVKEVAATLNKIATTHPNKSTRQQAKLAIRKLGVAQAAFGSACMCQSDVWNSDSN